MNIIKIIIYLAIICFNLYLQFVYTHFSVNYFCIILLNQFGILVNYCSYSLRIHVRSVISLHSPFQLFPPVTIHHITSVARGGGGGGELPPPPPNNAFSVHLEIFRYMLADKHIICTDKISKEPTKYWKK